ncbi:MAG TPA: ECF transporter S component [Ardenticatenaceae bacterium]|nr:ECF transporter S component [Ardenticatenaceae bacterium]
MQARDVALTGVMIALVTVVTLFVRLPSGIGYFNLSDTAIYFAAFAFGPLTGFLAGGVGTALADLIGYPVFALLTFFAHGLQGLVAGYVGRGGDWRRMLLGWALGTITMVGIYFVGEYWGAQFGWGGPPQATADLPTNLIQNLVGAVVSIPLVLAVRRAYPPLNRYT